MNDIVIRVYGDSISNPRYGQDISLWDIYCGNGEGGLLEKLQNKYPNKRVYIYNKSQNGTNIEKVKDVISADEGCFYGAQTIVILYIGIVDCAPRPIPEKIKKIISKTPEIVKSRIIKFLHDNRKSILKIKSHNITPPNKFEQTYNDILNCLQKSTKAICIGIGPVSQSMCQKTFGLETSIEQYNKIIENAATKFNVQFVDINKHFREIMEKENLNEQDVLLEDGHHFTPKGHKIASEIIYNSIQNLF